MFGKCLKWVFQVWLRRFPVGRDSLEEKKISKVKFLWIVAAMAGRFYEWESVFLGNTQGMFSLVPWVWLRSLSASTMAFYVYICQNDDNQFREIT